MHHCSPFVIDADVFQEHYCSEMASVILFSCVYATAKQVAPEKMIMKIPTKLWAASFIYSVEEKR